MRTHSWIKQLTVQDGSDKPFSNMYYYLITVTYINWIFDKRTEPCEEPHSAYRG